MRNLKRTITVILLCLFSTIVVKAEYEYLMLGETKTLKLPYNVVSLNNLKITSWKTSEAKDYIKCEHSYGTSIKVTGLSYTSKTIYISCDYEYTSAFDKKDQGNYQFEITIKQPYFDLTATPSGGSKLKKGQSVTLNCRVTNVEGFSSSDVKYYYSLDYPTPSIRYDGLYGITINRPCTLYAIATYKGAESKVLKEEYIVDGLFLTATPAGGVVEKGTIVYLSASENGADIYYTLDESTPSKSSIKYTSSGIQIKENCRLQAIAYYGSETSDVLIADYSLPVYPTDISVSITPSTIEEGETAKASYSLTPSNATTTVSWSSDDPYIASVDRSSGKVLGVSKGSTYIRAKTDNGLSGCSMITVTEAPVLGVTNASAGFEHSVIMREDGSVWTFGSNSSLQLGIHFNTYTVPSYINTPTQIDFPDAVSIASGSSITRIIKKDGSLWACGWNDYGQLGTNSTKNVNELTYITNNVASVTGIMNSFVIKKDGSLWVCGKNSEGQLGNGKKTDKATTKLEKVMDNVASVSSDSHTLIVKNDGSLWACGLNDDGQLGDGSTKSKLTPVWIMDDVVSAAAGYFHSLAIKSDGSLWAWGKNNYGQLCDGTKTDRYTPAKVMDDVISVEAISSATYFIKKDGSLWVCGQDPNYLDEWVAYTPKKLMDDVLSVSACGRHTLIVKKNLSLWAYGHNEKGQLGDGTNTNRKEPVQIIKGYQEDKPSGGVAIDEKNFPDKNFRKYLLEQDYGNDGVISENEIKRVNSIYVENCDIYNLKGIEFFTDLTYLNCSRNELTSLDVSNNSKLNVIYCYKNNIKGKEWENLINSLPYNYSVKNNPIYVAWSHWPITDYPSDGLTTDMVAKAKAKGWTPYYYSDAIESYLEYEGCDPFNIKIIVDETNFPDENFRKYLLEHDYGKDGVITGDEVEKLENISVPSLNIKSLQGIEYFTSLLSLECNSNQLTSLDISRNTALTNLYCGNNQIKTLDVSNNPNLNYLHCGYNEMTELDVSKNKELLRLFCYNNMLTSLDVSHNIALLSLRCDNNQLERIDVTKNTELTTLYCFSNKLSTLDITSNTKLKDLRCSSNELTSLDVSRNRELSVFWCANNRLTSLDLSKNSALTELGISKNQIKGENMDNLINSLPANTTDQEYQLYVLSVPSEDGNVCTKTQVKAIKTKGWVPYYNNKGWREYEGSDPSSIDGVLQNKTMEGPIYNLNGQRLDKPRKGINIIGGKKILVK